MLLKEYCDELAREFEQARHLFPASTSAIELQQALLEAASRLGSLISEPPISPSLVQERLQQGAPLLQEDDLTIDCDQLNLFRREVGGIISAHRPDLANQMESLLAVSEHHPCNGEAVPVEPADAELTAYLQRQTIYPFLRAHALTLEPLLPEEGGVGLHCPICGELPDMAALTRPDGGRMLLCRACDTPWRGPRVGCPVCNHDVSQAWTYYPSDDGVYRLYTCETCRCYLKTVDQRVQTKTFPLPVERILTARMDRAAIAAGYRIAP